jgi:uncharacterized coiled-coil protein SlyX
MERFDRLVGLLFAHQRSYQQRLNRLETQVALLQRKEARDMGKILDALGGLEIETDAAIARVQADVADLKAKIVDLQAQVDAGTAEPGAVEKIAELQAKLAALDPTVPAVLPVV